MMRAIVLKDRATNLERSARLARSKRSFRSSRGETAPSTKTALRTSRRHLRRQRGVEVASHQTLVHGCHLMREVVTFRRPEGHDGIEPAQSVSIPAHVFGNRRKAIHFDPPLLVCGSVELHVRPFEFLEGRLQCVEGYGPLPPMLPDL
jgi:hypothetical protein